MYSGAQPTCERQWENLTFCLMKRFKKLCEKEGLTKDIKRKEYYEKPSERRRRAARKAENRRAKVEF